VLQLTHLLPVTGVVAPFLCFHSGCLPVGHARCLLLAIIPRVQQRWICRPQVYAAPLAGGDRAVVLANFQTTSSQYPRTNITVFWGQVGLQPGQRVTVRDLYAGEGAGTD
jgi:hypothetical protein